MSVKITDNTVQITLDTTQRTSLALRYMLDAIDEMSSPKTPKDKGNLRRDKLKQVLGLVGTIEWRKRYARSQEAGRARGHAVRHYTTPGTGPHFAENAVRAVVKNAGQYFRKAKVI